MKASAEQADRLHTFSHDLRNRLIGLQQVLERFKDDIGAEDRAELLHYGEQQYFKALREVERLLDDMQVARGSIRTEPVAMDLRALVAERAEHMRFRFDRKGQELSLDLPGPVNILSDPRVLADLVDALLSNASKFTSEGARVEVRLRSDKDACTLEVQDHGQGLSPEDLAMVFERFVWLQSKPTSGESQGRGTLGRAHIWAQALNGSLTASSGGVGTGCTFSLRLPA